MRLPVDNVGSVGLVRDIFSADLPPEAWTAIRNIRMGPFGAEKFLGHIRTLNTGSAGWTEAPLWLMYIPDLTTPCWLGLGTTKIYRRLATSPYTESDQSRTVGGAYAASETTKWNGCFFGGQVIVNNGNDLPQLASSDFVLPFSNLSNFGTSPWPAAYRCGVLRSFGRFLVAADITKTATRYPQLVKWSHPADPGTYPTSWDPTDASKDAGEYPLNDAVGAIVDMLVLQNSNMIYTTEQVWAMNHTGGGDVFGFVRRLKEGGAIAGNCVAGFKKAGGEFHAVMSGNDLYWHNGQDIQSIVTPAMRRWLFQQIDVNYYRRSFVVANPTYAEVWFCFAENGATQPTLAVVWNWNNNTIGFRDLLKITSNGDTRTTVATQGTPCIALGSLADVSTETWASDSNTWASDSTLWVENTTSPAIPRLLMVDRSAGKRTFLLDSGYAFDTADITWQLERTHLAILGQDRQGHPKVDTQTIKLITEIWPRFEAPEGTTITVDVGVADNIDKAPSWEGSYTYTVGTDPFVAVYHSGRYISVRYSAANAVSTRLMGYALDLNGAGIF